MTRKTTVKKIISMVLAMLLTVSMFPTGGTYAMATGDLVGAVVEAEETPTPTEEPVTTETPVPTEEPEVTATPAPTETPAATEEPTATETPAPTETPAAAETPAPTETPAATETPEPTSTPEPTNSPEPMSVTLSLLDTARARITPISAVAAVQDGAEGEYTYTFELTYGGALQEQQSSDSNSFSYMAGAAGSYTLTVLVTDSEDQTASAELEISVLSAYSGQKDSANAEGWHEAADAVELSGKWAEDLVAVARTQIGYRESTIDYHVDEDYVQKGYSVYGDWYGSDYGDWCAMFIAFCLHYADIAQEDYPVSSGCDRWKDALIELGAYEAAADYTPQPGDLVFFHVDSEDPDWADHIGIVESVQDGVLTTIEGNNGDQVLRAEYVLADADNILGYANTFVLESEAKSSSVTAWNWVDDFEIIDAENNEAVIPGVSANNPIDYDTLVEFLPAYITATVNGAEEELALTWACADFPEDTATGGTYEFTAALPEGYALAEGVSALILTVDLGGAVTRTIAEEYSLSDLATDDDGYYLITNGVEWIVFAQAVNSGNTSINARLASEDLTIDLESDVAEVYGYDQLVQIGTIGKNFCGSIDGAGHTIQYPMSSTLPGLFCYLGDGATGGTIKDLNIYIDQPYDISYALDDTTSGLVGGLCSYLCGNYTLENVHITYNESYHEGSTHVRTAYFGGFIGRVYSQVTAGVISNCSVYFHQASGIYACEYAGGLVGYGYGTLDVSNCYTYFNNCDFAEGTIAEPYGLFGKATDKVTITNCYTNYSPASASNTVADDQYKDETQFASGEVCYLLNGSSSTDVTWFQTIGSWSHPYPSLYPSYYSKDIVYPVYDTCAMETYSSYTNNKDESIPDNHVFEEGGNGFCTICGAYEEPETDASGNYLIDNAGKLWWFACLTNGDSPDGDVTTLTRNSSANAILTADIDMSDIPEGVSWIPISRRSDYQYSGTIDGGGKTISNLTYTGAPEGVEVQQAGLISYALHPKIKNLTVSNFNISGASAVGTLCGMTYDITLENCHVLASNVSSSDDAGGMVGIVQQNGDISKCSSSAVVSGTRAGGLVGSAGIAGGDTTMSLTNCYNLGNVSGTYAGGLLGYAEGDLMSQTGVVVNITNCHSMGQINGAAATGTNAFYGEAKLTNQVTVTNCYYLADTGAEGAAETVLAKSADQFASGEVAYLLNSGVIDGTQVWYQDVDNDATPYDAYPLFEGGTVNWGYPGCQEAEDYWTKTYSNNERFDYPHSFDNGFCINADADGNVCDVYQRAILVTNTVGDTLDDDTPYQAYYEELGLSADYGKDSINEHYKYFAVTNAGQLYWVMHHIYMYIGGEEMISGKVAEYERNIVRGTTNVVLVDNITINSDLSDTTSARKWYSDTTSGTLDTPVFETTFDGNGHSISGIYCKEPSYYAGLFPMLSGATVRNLTIKNSFIEGDKDTGQIPFYVGILAGYVTNSVIEDVAILDSTIDAGYYVGALAGSTRYTEIRNCWSNSTVKADTGQAGGIVGVLGGGSIDSCYNTGSIIASESTNASEFGGIAGHVSLEGSISNCYNTGSVQAISTVGGIAGQVNAGSIDNCHNTGSIIATASNGGGIAGEGDSVSISRCYNTGSVQAATSAGGIAGTMSTLEDVSATIDTCYNTGSITATMADTTIGRAGGIVGYVSSVPSSISSCYSSGIVQSPDVAGGVVGFVASETVCTVSNCYSIGTPIHTADSVVNTTDVEEKISGQFASGEVAWLLNENQPESTTADTSTLSLSYYQELGEDVSPVFSGRIVYPLVNCMDKVTDFTNDTDAAVAQHTFDDNGFCINADAEGNVCGKYERAVLVTSAEGDTLTDATPYEAHYSELDLTADHVGYYAAGNAGQLYWIAEHVNSTADNDGTMVSEYISAANENSNYVLYRDITVNEDVFADDGSVNSGLRSWIPLGDIGWNYSLTFDGNGRTVSGLYHHGARAGFFFSTNIGVTIKNLTVANSYFQSSSSFAGGIAASMYGGTVYNCACVDSYIQAHTYAGGIVGGMRQEVAYVEKCWSNATVYTSNTGAGGIVGSIWYGSVKNCYSTGSLRAGTTGYAGGIAGNIDASAADTVIVNCYSTAVFTDNSGTTDPIVTVVSGASATVSNCYYLADTGAVGAAETTLAKDADQFASGEVAYLLNNGVKDGTQVWYQDVDNDAKPYDAYPIFEGGTVYMAHDCMSTPEGYSNTEGKSTGHSYNEHGFCENYAEAEDGTKTYCNVYQPAELDSATSFYQVDNAGKLFWMASLVNGTLADTCGDTETAQNTAAKILLLKDIDLSVAPDGLLWTPIGLYANYNADIVDKPFTGEFDGNNHVVTNMEVNVQAEAGFFGRAADGAVIHDLGVMGTVHSLDDRAGVFAGELSKCTVINCFAIGTATTEGVSDGDAPCQTGAFAGEASTSTLSNCYAYDSTNHLTLLGTGGTAPTAQTNCYYLAETGEEGSAETMLAKTADQFASGEVVWFLNGETAENAVFLQTLAAEGVTGDAYPTFTGEAVHRNANCAGELYGYTNDGAAAETNAAHDFDEHGFCQNLKKDGTTRCNAYEPALDETGEGVYEIDNPGKLYWFAAHVNNADPLVDEHIHENTVNTTVTNTTSVVLTGNIDLSAVPEGIVWVPIGQPNRDFQATFDGGNMSITNFSYSGDDTYNACDGLFSYVRNGTIEDFSIDGSMNITANSTASNQGFGVIGFAVGTVTVQNIDSALDIDLSALQQEVSNVGGIVGYGGGNTNISGCTYSGTITGPNADLLNYAGGMMGAGNMSTNVTINISGCTFSGKILSGDNGVAEKRLHEAGGILGITGVATVSITDCTNAGGSVIGGTYARGLGGILGVATDASPAPTITIARCDVWGDIAVSMGAGMSQQDCYGGIVAYMCPNATYTIEDCGFYGTISSNTDNQIRQVGGILGYHNDSSANTSMIKNCLSVGTITGALDTNNGIGAVGGVLRNRSGGNITIDNTYYRYDSDTECTYKDAVGSNGNTDNVSTGFIAKTETELNSGEVTWLLNEQLPAYEGDTTALDSLVWHQDIDVEPKDPYPIFNALVVYPTVDDNNQPTGSYYNEKIVSVDIQYGALTFTYVGIWDPDTHTYASGKWELDETDGDLVKVTNAGTIDVNVGIDLAEGHEVANSGLADDGITVALANWKKNGSAIDAPTGTTMLVHNDVLQTQVAVSGEPNDTFISQGQMIGQVTVSLSLPATD